MKKQLATGLLAIIISLYLSLVSSNIIATFFTHRPIVDDLFFRITPFVPGFAYIADIVQVLGVVIFAIMIVHHPEYTERILMSLALMWTFRAGLNILTPMGDPSGDIHPYGFLEVEALYGMFPSGHTALVVVALTWSRILKETLLRRILWGLLALEIFALLVTRGHYSIDIVGGSVLGWGCVLLIIDWYRGRQSVLSQS